MPDQRASKWSRTSDGYGGVFSPLKKKTIDFGRIHNGLPRRVHAWFDVAPEESPARRETAAAYLKAAGIAIRAPGEWGLRAVKTGLHTADFRADDSAAMFTNYGVSPRRKRVACMAIDWNA